ncbi:hypothetical protein ABZ845_21330 [Streptomyces sp. NPDC047022]|uniref:hypothetical protein n=1 Tax=Streptomyces sp. NPDC047022 TaxID=3155737 RepID=UPI0033E8B89D
MLKGLVPVLAWSLATGAAVTLSWWGVHTVMAGTAYDPPRALPITAGGATAQGARPVATSTEPPSSRGARRESPSASAMPSASGSGGRAGHGASPTAAASSAPGASGAYGAPGQVKSYDTDGGRVVFDIGGSSATLVSATPGAGWSMQVWKTDTWIRVEFTSGAQRVSVFCTWHDGPPHVEIGNY